MDWEKVAEQFLIFKEAQGCADSTLELYKWQFKKFFEAVADDDIEAGTMKYFSALRGQAPTTYNIALRCMKCFFRWCQSRGLIEELPTKDLKQRRDEPKIRNIPLDIILKLLKQPDRKTFAGLRDYGLMLLQLDTGIRPGEAVQLLPEHFNLKAREVLIPAQIAKARYSRTLPFSFHTLDVVQQLLLARPDDWGPEVPVFASTRGEQISRVAYGRRMQKYSEDIGERITPYDLRHTFALEYLRNGGDVFSLQRMMGHANLEMTKRYVALAQADIKQIHGQASPVNKLLNKRTRVGKL